MTSIFRTALQVSPEQIALLTDVQLNDLMRELLHAQAYLEKSDKTLVNTEVKAKDDGCDAWSSAGTNPKLWITASDTCWQLKAGVASQPNKLAGEVLKPIPSETLRNGGRLVLVASASSNGPKGEKDRLTVLVEEAKAAGLPVDKIEVYGSEQLAGWCNEHPAIAASLAGRPDSVFVLRQWLASDEHDGEWQPGPTQLAAIADLQRKLDFSSDDVLHLHVSGHPGVGKTRFALELCRTAPWATFVVYVRQAADLQLSALLVSCANDPLARVVVVADEVQLNDLLPLRSVIATGGGRLRLITIGTSTTPDPERIVMFDVLPLAVHDVTKVIRQWHPSMPPEHADFAARFSDGYMRLARLAAGTIKRNPTIDVPKMLDERHIGMFLDQMLGTADRGALFVVAALSSVGWSEDSEQEGQAIAEHLGMDWNRVKREVDAFDRQFRIAPRGGRLRYISPEPLATYLALEAWRNNEAAMRSLPSKLSEAGVDAYYERLKSLASSPQAGQLGREALDRFFPVADLNDARAMRRWAALASASPQTAARRMCEELIRRSVDERRLIDGRARRTLIFTLVALAWSTSSFDDAVHSLALLAEAENESATNNATGEFLHRFTVFLSGTALPYADRLRTLEPLLSVGSTAKMKQLAFLALSQVGLRSAFRVHIPPITGGLPEEEWQPASAADYAKIVVLAVDQLAVLASSRETAFEGVVTKALHTLSVLLRESAVAEAITKLFAAAGAAYPSQREALRRMVAEVVHRERKYFKKLDATELMGLDSLLLSLEDSSITGRLRELVGPGSKSENVDQVRELALRFASVPGDLKDQWPWLTSGEGNQAWTFGDALGEQDLDSVIVELVRSEHMGQDGRVACAYLARRSRTKGADWLEELLDGLHSKSSHLDAFVIEATWRLTPTSRGARRLHTVIARGAVSPNALGQLAYGAWDEQVGADEIRPVLTVLASSEHTVAVALAMLRTRLSKCPGEFSAWADLGLRLATSDVLIRSERDDGYEWAELAKLFVASHPKQLFAAIVRQQAIKPPTEGWFLEHTLANGVAQSCVTLDPLGTWEALRPYLEAPYYQGAYALTIGFPAGLVDMMDREAVLNWVKDDPEPRAALLGQLTGRTLSDDDSLAAILIDLYGALDLVSQEFESRTTTGMWYGSLSEHWRSIAEELQQVALKTKRPGLRKFAAQLASRLRDDSERIKQREEERDLRGRD